jgi:hypothetical protein
MIPIDDCYLGLRRGAKNLPHAGSMERTDAVPRHRERRGTKTGSLPLPAS